MTWKEAIVACFGLHIGAVALRREETCRTLAQNYKAELQSRSLRIIKTVHNREKFWSF
jgi:hypothetical protein